jgi:hypothetical protein
MVIVVGGHTRNIGKTSVVAGLIAAVPEYRWTAVKITQFGHGVCSANGEPCDCDTGDHTVALSEELKRSTGTDTSRFLAAGAERSLWLRTRQGDLASGMPRLRARLLDAQNVIVESNSVLRFLKPDIFLSVLDPAVADFKSSALRYLDRADAILVPPGTHAGGWQSVSDRLVTRLRHIEIAPPTYVSEELVLFVRAALEKAGAQSSSTPAAV